MRWIGLNDGYVSGDGLFLVAQVTVEGRRGTTTKWVLYGVVRLQPAEPTGITWRWSDTPIYGPAATKRDCQTFAATARYEPPVIRLDGSPAPAEATAPSKVMGYGFCQECGVEYKRPTRWIYEDYCGPNCFGIVEERVRDIRANLNRRVA